MLGWQPKVVLMNCFQIQNTCKILIIANNTAMFKNMQFMKTLIKRHKSLEHSILSKVIQNEQGVTATHGSLMHTGTGDVVCKHTS